jgi:hypothetical protein
MPTRETRPPRKSRCTVCTEAIEDTGHGFYHVARPLGTVRGIPPHFAKPIEAVS